MFDWLYNLLGTMLWWFSSITGGSYALALLFYALLFKIAFLPFSIKQQKNQIKMAKLTPKIEIIKAKYKGRNDPVSRQKLQQEIMELQQKEGYSIMSGCLPMLLQLPIIIFLYNVIRKPLSFICRISEENVVKLNSVANGLTEDAAFKGIDQISLISKINEAGIDIGAYGATRELPNFQLWGQNLAQVPTLSAISLLCLIPLIAASLQWVVMAITRKLNGNANQVAGAQDPQTQMSMKIMDLMLPAMTLWLTFTFPAVLGIYWIYQSLLALIQTFIISKIMPMPRYTEEELKAMKKAQKEAEKVQKAALKAQPKYKSLHYIDEDDYDELPTLSSQNNKPAPKGMSEKPEIKD